MKQINVLVVEDHTHPLATLVNILQQNGFSAVAALLDHDGAGEAQCCKSLKHFGGVPSKFQYLAFRPDNPDALNDNFREIRKLCSKHRCCFALLDLDLTGSERQNGSHGGDGARLAKYITEPSRDYPTLLYGIVLVTKRYTDVPVWELVEEDSEMKLRRLNLPPIWLVRADDVDDTNKIPGLLEHLLNEWKDKARSLMDSLTAAERLRAATLFGGCGNDLFHHRVGDCLWNGEGKLRKFFDEVADTELRAGGMPPCTIETLMSLFGKASPRKVQDALEQCMNELKEYRTQAQKNFPGQHDVGLDATEQFRQAVELVYQAERDFEELFGAPSLAAVKKVFEEAAKQCPATRSDGGGAEVGELCASVEDRRLRIGSIAELEVIADNLITNGASLTNAPDSSMLLATKTPTRRKPYDHARFYHRIVLPRRRRHA